MIPMFFGATDRPLFGVFHPALGSSTARAALISGPVGHEYVRVHRLCRRLANSLAPCGISTLRFDFTGQGDSFGEDEDGDIEVWQRDLLAAADELRDLSGGREITVFGIRLGATIAALIDRFPSQVDTLVLWDPVVLGGDYVRDLKDWHRASFSEPAVNGSSTELLGTVMSSKLLDELNRVDLGEFTPGGEEAIVLAHSESRPEFARLGARLEQLGVPYETHLVTDDYSWHDHSQLEKAVTAPKMILTLMAQVGPDG